MEQTPIDKGFTKQDLKAQTLTQSQKDVNRKYWCAMLYHAFNVYYKQNIKSEINSPYYVLKVFSYVGLIDLDGLDASKTKDQNSDIIYSIFDDLIQKKHFIGDYLVEFRAEFEGGMPF